MKSLTASKSLDLKLESVRGIGQVYRPHKGWIKAVREAFGMTTKQLGARLGVSQPRVVALEKAEMEETVTLASLRKAAGALECSLVYVFVPRESFQATLEDRARAVAMQLTAQVDRTMALEDQQLDAERRARVVEALTQRLLQEKARFLWDE
jgi:predicted DNA-binding mobile mystery protein A